ncbi:MAG: Uma2 family endonuclease [bacterium]|nr:Uma2 family endonuclease [bacterium]
MNVVAKKVELFTYGHLLEWPEDERWELIDGIAYDMAAAPATRHQIVLGDLYRQISVYLLDKTCHVFLAPFDIRLPEAEEKEEDIRNVLQPDISVICDPKKIDERGCLGSPDLVIEVLSPSTAQKDKKVKFATYERFGVNEYWIVHPQDMTLTVFKLLAGKSYGRPDVYLPEDKVSPGVLPELIIDLSTVFRFNF